MSDPDKPVTHGELNFILAPVLEKQSEQIDATKETNKALQDLTVAISQLASEKGHLEKEVENVKADVSSIKKQFFSTWEWSSKLREGMFKWIVPLVCTGLFLSAATALGYIKVS